MISKDDIHKLFEDTQRAYFKAPVSRYNWHYSISSTKLTTSSIVIAGFNWGVNGYHQPQTSIPDLTFKELFERGELGSLQRIYTPLLRSFNQEEVDNCVQTNFCFFRSECSSQITEEDLKQSTPLFLRLLYILRPKMVIGFSSHFRDYFINKVSALQMEKNFFKSGNKHVIVAKGIYSINGLNVPICFLPHPNAPFRKEALEQARKFVFSPFNSI